MKKLIAILLSLLFVMSFQIPSYSVKANVSTPTVTYAVHVQSYGDQAAVTSSPTNIKQAGTTGSAKRLERITVKLNDTYGRDIHVSYRVHCQSIGWMPWVSDGEKAGTEGFAKRLEAIQIILTGKDSNDFDIYYRVHAQTYGWLGWARNGASAGTSGLSKRLEAIQIVVVPKGQVPTTSPANSSASGGKAHIGSSDVALAGVRDPHINYCGHVQSYGDMLPVANGMGLGTKGEAKRVEAIKIWLSNSIAAGYPGSGVSYKCHVQSYGDQSTRSNGQMAGTSGEAKRIENISIWLTGPIANDYDIYYRVHGQSYGDQGWKKNGEVAGTSGQGKRIEMIWIQLVKKGADGSSSVTPVPTPTPTPVSPSCSHNWVAKKAIKHTVTKDVIAEEQEIPEKYTYYVCPTCGKNYTLGQVSSWVTGYEYFTSIQEDKHMKACGIPAYHYEKMIKRSKGSMSYSYDRMPAIYGEVDHITDGDTYYQCSKCGMYSVDGKTHTAPAGHTCTNNWKTVVLENEYEMPNIGGVVDVCSYCELHNAYSTSTHQCEGSIYQYNDTENGRVFYTAHTVQVCSVCGANRGEEKSKKTVKTQDKYCEEGIHSWTVSPVRDKDGAFALKGNEFGSVKFEDGTTSSRYMIQYRLICNHCGLVEKTFFAPYTKYYWQLLPYTGKDSLTVPRGLLDKWKDDGKVK